MSERAYYLVTMAAAILLPLVPAAFLFWVLPGRASAEGSFMGMKVKLSGAFAAYFVLFLLLSQFFPAPPVQTYSVWHIEAVYALEGQPDVLSSSDISLIPSATVAGNLIRLDIPVGTSEAGQPKFPSLQVNHPPCHSSSTIDLNQLETSDVGGTSRKVDIEKRTGSHEVILHGIYLPIDANALRPDGAKCNR